jgi:flotillin
MHLDLSNGGTIVIVAVGAILAIFFLMGTLARLYRKAGPHEALVVYGMRRTRIIRGRGTVIFPMVENWRGLSLELMSFDVADQGEVGRRFHPYRRRTVSHQIA